MAGGGAGDAWGAWVAAATYTWNYVRVPMPWPRNWALAHCWSLSLEEQFYLLWPLVMSRLPKRTCVGAVRGGGGAVAGESGGDVPGVADDAGAS